MAVPCDWWIPIVAPVRDYVIICNRIVLVTNPPAPIDVYNEDIRSWLYTIIRLDDLLPKKGSDVATAVGARGRPEYKLRVNEAVFTIHFSRARARDTNEGGDNMLIPARQELLIAVRCRNAACAIRVTNPTFFCTTPQLNTQLLMLAAALFVPAILIAVV